MLNFRSIKTQLVLFLFVLAAFLVIKDSDGAFLIAFSVCVVTAIAVEAVVLYFKNKKIQVTESAIIAGMIMGFVLSSDVVWWKLALAVTLAILSKYVLRLRNKHIFNPAALGLFLAVLVLGVSLQWKATYWWYFLVPCGIYLAYKIRKLELLAGYAGVSLLLFGGQALLHKAPILNIFGYFSYFYIFVMIIEPKTTPSDRIGKYVFGAALAGIIFILTEISVDLDVELFSLLVMNAAVPLWNKMSTKHGGAV
jgi:Na+-translocating ferredoxin:NAD+ oxidoreductase RnfD subunit